MSKISTTGKLTRGTTFIAARQPFGAGFRQDSAAPPGISDNHISQIIPVVLLAALSVLAVSAIYEAPAAFADHPGYVEIWSATLTMSGGGGCNNVLAGSECSSPSVLTDDDFTYGGVNYALTAIRGHSGGIQLTLDRTFPEGIRSAGTIYVDGSPFNLAGANFPAGNTVRVGSGLSWNTGDTVQLRLIETFPTLTASISGNPREGANLWSTTMTTYDLSTPASAPANRGCDDTQAGARCISALTDNDFTFDGVAYTVKAISYNQRQATQDPNNLYNIITYQESLKLTLDKAIPESLITCLTLHAGDAKIPLAGDDVVGAGVDTALSASNGVADSTVTLTEITGAEWGLGWSAGGTAQLTMPDVGCLTMTLSEPVEQTTSMQIRVGGTADNYIPHPTPSIQGVDNRQPGTFGDYNYIKLPTFAAGSTTASTKILPVDDTLVEGCETVILDMTMWPGTAQAVHERITVYIEDNDGGDSCPAASSPTGVAVPESAQLPVITLAGSTNMTVPLNSVWTDPGYTATGSDGDDITASVTISGAVDTSQAATYLLYYQVADAYGTPATPQIRTVHVVAPEPQQLTQEPQPEPQQEAEQGAEQEPAQEAEQEPQPEPQQEAEQGAEQEPEQEPTQEPQQEPEQEPTQEPAQEPQQEPEGTESSEQQTCDIPAIVRQYDADGSCKIEQSEWLVAIADYTADPSQLTTPQIQQIAAHRG